MNAFISRTYQKIKNQLLKDIPVIKNNNSSLLEFYVWCTGQKRNLSRHSYELATIFHAERCLSERLSYFRGDYIL